jgi:FkbM family methyltransferase
MNSIEYLNDKKFNIYYPENVEEAVIKAIKSGRIWEKKLLNYYKELILPGDTVLDIGAYLGTHTVAFSQLVGDTGKVMSFEPQEQIFTLLEKTIKENNIINVELHNTAVYNINKKIQFSETNNGKASISYIRPRLPNPVKKVVDAITIDSLKLERCDFIKLDVEKCEWVVLEGSEETITKYRPILFVEIFKTPANLLKLRTFTQKHNYSYTNLGGADFVLLPN